MMTWSRTRFLALMLFASVSINLFVAGIAIGRWDHWGFQGRPGDGPDGRRPPLSRVIEDTLGDSITPELRQLIEHHGEAMRATRDRARESRRLIRDVLLTEPFDRDAYLKALDDMKEVHDHMRDETHSFMVDIVERLTPEQRRQLVRSLERPKKPFGKAPD